MRIGVRFIESDIFLSYPFALKDSFSVCMLKREDYFHRGKVSLISKIVDDIISFRLLKDRRFSKQ